MFRPARSAELAAAGQIPEDQSPVPAEIALQVGTWSQRHQLTEGTAVSAPGAEICPQRRVDEDRSNRLQANSPE